MKDRIIRFIEAENLTAAEFADKIGVQRSNVSHVLNGRNNPGFSFIQKILESFPSINSRWLITGEGDIYINKKTGIDSSTINFFLPEKPKEAQTDKSHSEIIEGKINPSEKGVINEKGEISNKSDIQKSIIKVLLFYKDHTFEDFRPAE